MRGGSFVFVVAFLVIVLGGVGAVYAYDSSKSGVIAKGVKVGGVGVSGLTRAQARARLRRLYLPELRRPVVVRWRGERWALPARRARVSADLEGTIDDALARSRSGNIISRTARNLTGGNLDVALEPQVSYSPRAVRGLLLRVGRTVDRPVKEPDVAFGAGGPHAVPGHDGRALRRTPLKRGVEAALVGTGPRALVAQATVIRPKRTTADVAQRYPVLLVLNRSAFRLSLYDHLKLAKSYTVAVGQQGLETPAGLYHIQNKAVNPAWQVPNSAWAGSLAGQVIPGGAPNNPIKARWLGIFDGAGIHGTTELSSLGTAASHGCVRMAIPDVIDLYPRVPVGTPIYIA